MGPRLRGHQGRQRAFNLLGERVETIAVCGRGEVMPTGVYKRTRIPLAIRLWAKVRKTETCWLWEGSFRRDGYGQINVGSPKAPLATHRVAYQITFGKIPNGKCVLHTCDVRACVNPQHLFLGTRGDNTNDMVQKGRACFGEKQPNSKLKTEQVQQIRKRFIAGERNRDLAVLFSVSPSHIHRLVYNKQWKHLDANHG